MVFLPVKLRLQAWVSSLEETLTVLSGARWTLAPTITRQESIRAIGLGKYDSACPIHEEVPWGETSFPLFQCQVPAATFLKTSWILPRDLWGFIPPLPSWQVGRWSSEMIDTVSVINCGLCLMNHLTHWYAHSSILLLCVDLWFKKPGESIRELDSSTHMSYVGQRSLGLRGRSKNTSRRPWLLSVDQRTLFFYRTTIGTIGC